MRVPGEAPAHDKPASAGTAFGQFRNVRQCFRRAGQAELLAIDGISFDLDAGTLVSLLGPSGCGKTTFLRIAGGLIRATSGTVWINGAAVIEPHADFGMAFQQPNLMPWRTVLGNVLFPMELRGETGPAVQRRASDMLALVGLQGFERAYPAQLSGGMQQRVALCRALVHEPKLLLMDEPFGALDELTRMEMQDLLLDIRAKTGATIMFVTHSISEAVYLSDAIVVFSRRPAVIADYVEVRLPYPRSAAMRYSPAFTELEHRAGRALGIIR
ncbi:MAG: ABC transporter ATP-binding protein [Xanthobacteraceae bacterium]